MFSTSLKGYLYHIIHCCIMKRIIIIFPISSGSQGIDSVSEIIFTACFYFNYRDY